MPTSEKVDKVEELTAALSNARAIYLADFTGLDVAKVTGLRNKLRDAEVGYQVVKNRLAKRAAAEAGARKVPRSRARSWIGGKPNKYFYRNIP